jgi:lysozyme family protein
MADFKTAILLTLQHEGGYVNNPNDSGGETNMGITAKDMPGQDMKVLTVEQATEYYTQNYWKALYSQINDQNLANKLFDMGVLFGVGTAVKILQTIFAVNQVVADGVFGPHTLDIVNTAGPIGLLGVYKVSLVSHALGVVNANPNDRVFFAGWVKRINS